MIPSLYNAGSASPANTQSVISPSRSEPNVNCSSSSLSSFFFPPSLDPVSVPFEQAERTNINTKDKMIILNFFFKTFSPLYFCFELHTVLSTSIYHPFQNRTCSH